MRKRRNGVEVMPSGNLDPYKRLNIVTMEIVTIEIITTEIVTTEIVTGNSNDVGKNFFCII